MYVQSKGITLKDVFIPATNVARIDDLGVRVIIADTEEERIQGLSGRLKLEGADAMLFVFSEADYHGIWMKDMRFPIDLIWVGEDLKVINVEKNVTPDTFPRTFRPGRPAKYLFETNIHYADTFDIAPGDTVKLPPEIVK
jgi:hypothetical protein